MEVNTELKEEIWDLLNTKWNLIILRSLDLKTMMRFNELKQSISGISANILSDRLEKLEKLGLIKKIVSTSEPHHVGYTLQESCKELKKILLELDEWVSLLPPNTFTQEINQNSLLSKQLLEFLRNQVTETEFNFINDKLLFSLGTASSDIISNFDKLKNIIIELYGDEAGNKIVKSLTDHLNHQK